MESGAPCVMMGGASLMQMLCAESWDIHMHCLTSAVRDMVRAVGESGWMGWVAQEWNNAC